MPLACKQRLHRSVTGPSRNANIENRSCDDGLDFQKHLSTVVFCLFIFCSPYSRNFSPATSQANTGMSSYLPIMSPGLDQQQQIMWPTSGQTDEFLAARGGKLPEFHRFTSSSFVNQTKNSHFSSFSPQVSFHIVNLIADRSDTLMNKIIKLFSSFIDRVELLLVINIIERPRHEATVVGSTFGRFAGRPRPTIPTASARFAVALSQWVLSPNTF